MISTKQLKRIDFVLSLGVIVAGVLAPTKAQSDEVGLPRRSGVLKVSIKSEKPAYRSGEDIQIQVTLFNVSATRVAVRADAPWFLCNLNITQNGALLPQPTEHAPATLFRSAAFMYRIKPGGRVTAEWQSYEGGASHSRYWSDVSSWGYSLSAPGTYTISAKPILVAIGNGGAFMSSPNDRSNTITVRITPRLAQPF